MKRLRHMGMGIIAVMDDEQYSKSRKYDAIFFISAAVVLLTSASFIIWLS